MSNSEHIDEPRQEEEKSNNPESIKSYNILKNLGDNLVKDMEITELALCPECNNSLFSDFLKALTLLECGYVYHRLNFALHICRGIAYLNALGINNKFITMF
ncbi:hypothetical protein RhiirC2_736606 [Rhizophagus irregularis]|uniref:Uncharacterized protein n=1 Tax=Rhizophagus irregularis TaxID=588596 RepID=A0A2N1NNL8_9GLOM|nr:hypothetical protein RhiirC2_736606 [Rhizophagus irregularis]